MNTSASIVTTSAPIGDWHYHPQPIYYYSPWWFTPLALPACTHCWCKDAVGHLGEGPHAQCCKCGTTMGRKFIPDTP